MQGEHQARCSPAQESSPGVAWKQPSHKEFDAAAGMADGAWSDCGSDCGSGKGGDSPTGSLGPCSRACRSARFLGTRRRDFGLPVGKYMVFNLLVGSVCCGAASMMAPVWLLARVALAFVSMAGFLRLFWHFRKPQMQLRCPPIRLLAATAAATAATMAASVVVAAVAMVATATHVVWRAAIDYGVGREPRRWYATFGSLVLDGLELGALLLQMMYMTQWVFGEFSVMPVMTTMGMMFAVMHNFSLFVATEDPLFWREDVL